MKTNIKTYGASQLKTRLQELGEPAYRAGQVAEWLYARQAGSFEEMTNLSKGLREKLASEYAIILPRLIQREVSSDGSRKYLIEVEDNDVVECVGIPEENRLTVCFSTQVGCAMGCVFCATGAQGFKRSLGPGE
ncbi:MAG: 23S rRNA (adenine(2503)-C(2))-methyltransferase RlmN, partial [Coriobacteriales bacterium]|nr:23S rRNA (adenine(2503)-C(2))-methyltransferase RlmN [Coriobacteriales bacterium]